MLALGMEMNEFVIHQILGKRRIAGANGSEFDLPDGAIIIAKRKVNHDGLNEWVIAEVHQDEIDSPEPARMWSWGDYTRLQMMDRAGMKELFRAALLRAHLDDGSLDSLRITI